MGDSKNAIKSASTKHDLDMKKSTLYIVQLPEVVKIHVCSFLDVSSLMNLRLTCKDLKLVVEQATILQKFPIKISSSKQLQKVLESQVPFNNFKCRFKSLEEQSYFSEFAKRFGSHIRKLCITTPGGHEKTLQLLAKCTQLKELEITTLNTHAYQSNSDSLETALTNIRGLTILTIHNLVGKNNIAGNDTIKFFLKVLNNCRYLVEFKIPKIDEYDQKLMSRRQARNYREQDQIHGNDLNEEDWEQDTVQNIADPFPEWDNRDSHDILIHPILAYLRMKASHVNLPKVKRINVEGIYLFEEATLKDFLQVCQETGIHLLRINSIQFINIHNEVPLLNNKYFNAVQSADLSGIHNAFPLAMLENLVDLKVFINPWAFIGLKNESDLSLSHLKSLRVQFMFNVVDLHSQLIIKKLFKEYKRLELQRLQLEWSLHESCPTISAIDLVHNFKYIRELEIDAWNTIQDADFCILWTNLQALEKVVIKDCKNLTNHGFIGNFDLNDESNIERRPLNQLTKLKSLTIRDCSGNVNEVAFMNCFRWIKLRYFDFDSTVLEHIREEVYESLIRSPLGKSVEYFIAPRPCTKSTFFKRKAIMQGFKNLKRRIPW